MNLQRRLSLVALLICSIPSFAVAQDKLLKATEHMVPMADGVRLATDVFLPPGKGPFPVILGRSPYGKKGMSDGFARTALGHGYAFVSQDFRGRGKSQGHHAIIFHNDGWAKRHDGQDAIAWIAKQPWCDGRIGTLGASAPGIVVNMTAPGAPKELKAQFVGVAYSDMYRHAAFQGGVFRKSLLEGWLKGTGMLDVNLETFVAHPKYDSFWAENNALAQAGRVTAPALFYGGWYDCFLQGTLDSFVAIHNQGGEGARGRCRLIILPAAHGTFDTLKYPENSRKLPKSMTWQNWVDYVLKGEKNGVENEKPVQYYLMGDTTDPKAPGNEWRTADNWPPPAKAKPYYFHADGKLSLDTSANDGKRSFRYDPKNPVSTFGGQELFGALGPQDQRKVESRPDVLLFTSEILEKPLEITGRLTAKLHVSSNCPDTDFTVKVTDVYPDGRSMLVTDGIKRARFRQSFEREDFLEPGKVYELSVDLWSTALVFNKGHRIRIAVSSSNAPRFEPNPNTGHPFRADAETRVAENTVHLSGRYPSHIVLPVLPE